MAHGFMQASLITARHGACAVIFSNYIIVVGGQRPVEMTSENAVEIYSVRRNEWKQIKLSGNYTGVVSSSCALFTDGESSGCKGRRYCFIWLS